MPTQFPSLNTNLLKEIYADMSAGIADADFAKAFGYNVQIDGVYYKELDIESAVGLKAWLPRYGSDGQFFASLGTSSHES